MDIVSMVQTAGHLVSVERPQFVENEIQERVVAGWTIVSSELEAWIQPASAAVQLLYAQRELTVSHKIYFAEDPAIVEGDRLLYGDRRFSIVGKRQPGGFGAFWVVMAWEEQ